MSICGVFVGNLRKNLRTTPQSRITSSEPWIGYRCDLADNLF